MRPGATSNANQESPSPSDRYCALLQYLAVQCRYQYPQLLGNAKDRFRIVLSAKRALLAGTNYRCESHRLSRCHKWLGPTGRPRAQQCPETLVAPPPNQPLEWASVQCDSNHQLPTVRDAWLVGGRDCI